jgi:hypothetical protein
VIQNDIGTTDAHVIVIHVVELSVPVQVSKLTWIAANARLVGRF